MVCNHNAILPLSVLPVMLPQTMPRIRRLIPKKLFRVWDDFPAFLCFTTGKRLIAPVGISILHIFPLTLKYQLSFQDSYFTCKIPTRNVRVLAISTLCASLDSVSTTVPVLLAPVALLLSMIKFSSGAMLKTTDPTIKLTTGNGPVMTNRTCWSFICIEKKHLSD